jgi:putative oxidoreductase
VPLIRRLGRELLAPMFVSGGLDSFRNPESKIARAEHVTKPLAEAFGLPDDPVGFVRFNGAVQVVAGTMLAVNRVPRLAALVLAGSLIPTTLAGHPFWAESDPRGRAAQRTQFLKNAAMLGGLLVVVSERTRPRKEHAVS